MPTLNGHHPAPAHPRGEQTISEPRGQTAFAPALGAALGAPLAAAIIAGMLLSRWVTGDPVSVATLAPAVTLRVPAGALVHRRRENTRQTPDIPVTERTPCPEAATRTATPLEPLTTPTRPVAAPRTRTRTRSREQTRAAETPAVGRVRLAVDHAPPPRLASGRPAARRSNAAPGRGR